MHYYKTELLDFFPFLFKHIGPAALTFKLLKVPPHSQASAKYSIQWVYQSFNTESNCLLLQDTKLMRVVKTKTATLWARKLKQ